MAYNISTTWTVILIIVAVWELVWKSMALWRAARLNQPVWFTVLLVINSAGVLPIAYLLSHHENRHIAARS